MQALLPDLLELRDFLLRCQRANSTGRRNPRVEEALRQYIDTCNRLISFIKG